MDLVSKYSRIDHIELGEYEAAALEEARKTDIRTMKSNLIERDLNDSLRQKDDEIQIANGNN